MVTPRLLSAENELLVTRQGRGFRACGQVRLHWLQSAESHGLVFETRAEKRRRSSPNYVAWKLHEFIA